MKDQVAVAPSGELCVLIPLYRLSGEKHLINLDGYSMFLTNGKPLAYVLDCAVGCTIVNAEFVEEVEFLGDL